MWLGGTTEAGLPSHDYKKNIPKPIVWKMKKNEATSYREKVGRFAGKEFGNYTDTDTDCYLLFLGGCRLLGPAVFPLSSVDCRGRSPLRVKGM